jgi:hypothetical protein
MKYNQRGIASFGVGAIICALVIYGFSPSKEFQTKEIEPKNKQKLYKVMSSPLPKNLSPKETISERGVPKKCLDQWGRLISSGTESFIKNLEQNKTEDFSECLDFIPHATAVKSYIQLTCKGQDGRFAIEGTCPISILFYRALLIDLQTKDDVNFSQMSLQVLLHKILGRMLQGEEVYLKSREQMMDMANNIKELEPNNPSTYKILSVIQMLTNPGADILPLVNEGLSHDPHDEHLRELWLYSHVQKEKFDIADYASSHPLDDIATYYHADDLWKTGQLKLARRMVRELTQRFPENSRYKKTMETMKTAGEQDRPFYVDIPILHENW